MGNSSRTKSMQAAFRGLLASRFIRQGRTHDGSMSRKSAGFPAYKNGDPKPKRRPRNRRAGSGSNAWRARDQGRSLLQDGKRMFVSVGSASNDAEGMPVKTPREIGAWQARKGIGAAWSFEENLAMCSCLRRG